LRPESPRSDAAWAEGEIVTRADRRTFQVADEAWNDFLEETLHRGKAPPTALCSLT